MKDDDVESMLADEIRWLVDAGFCRYATGLKWYSTMEAACHSFHADEYLEVTGRLNDDLTVTWTCCVHMGSWTRTGTGRNAVDAVRNAYVETFQSFHKVFHGVEEASLDFFRRL